ncbi:MAG TPA: hypothetical protein VFG62_10375 [Rhodopila sp.]|nr:hypothetical protein [Rhodopila sp.]
MAVARPQGRRTGRLAPSPHDPAIPHWSALKAMRGVVQPPIPEALSWRRGMPAFLGAMGNAPGPDNPELPVVGDCTNAGAGHLQQVWTFNAGGRMVTRPAMSVIQGYSESCGYVLGDPATDNGGLLTTVLKYWMTTGMPNADGTRETILGFFRVDPRQPEDVRRVIAECGGFYGGALIPASWSEVEQGQAWQADGPGVEGHCITGFGYNPETILCHSWGFDIPTADDVFTRYFDELYAVVSAEWIEKTGKTPFGMTLSALNASLDQLQRAVAAGG